MSLLLRVVLFSAAEHLSNRFRKVNKLTRASCSRWRPWSSNTSHQIDVAQRLRVFHHYKNKKSLQFLFLDKFQDMFNDIFQEKTMRSQCGLRLGRFWRSWSIHNFRTRRWVLFKFRAGIWWHYGYPVRKSFDCHGLRIIGSSTFPQGICGAVMRVSLQAQRHHSQAQQMRVDRILFWLGEDVQWRKQALMDTCKPAN